MAKKYADVRIDVTVAFEDDEVMELESQALEAAENLMSMTAIELAGMEVIGKVRDTEMPAQ